MTWKIAGDSVSNWTSRDDYSWIIVDLNKEKYLSSVALHSSAPKGVNTVNSFLILIKRETRKWLEIISFNDNKHRFRETDLRGILLYILKSSLSAMKG